MARIIRTKEGAFNAVKKDSMALYNVLEELKTAELCLEAVKGNGYALVHVPEKLRTAELCLEAIRHDKESGNALGSVPENLKTMELCLEALKNNSLTLQYVPEDFKTAEICLEAVKQKGQALQYVPKELRTAELCQEAVRRQSYAIFWVPEEHMTAELCLEAVQLDGWTLESIPGKFKTVELCVTAVEKNGGAIDYVPQELLEKVKKTLAAIRYEVWDSSTPPQKLGIRASDKFNSKTYSFLNFNNYLLSYNKDGGLTSTAIRFSEANQGGYPMFAIREPNWILYNPHNGGTFYEFCDKTFPSSVDGYQSSYAADGTPQNSNGGTGTDYYQMRTISREKIGIPDVITPPLIVKSTWGGR